MILLNVVLALVAQTPDADCRQPVNQAEMNECAEADFVRADAALNQAWRAALPVVREADRDAAFDHDGRPSGESQLLASERAWLAFRDAQCTLEGYAMRGGSAEAMVDHQCRTRLTRERTTQLRALAQPN